MISPCYFVLSYGSSLNKLQGMPMRSIPHSTAKGSAEIMRSGLSWFPAITTTGRFPSSDSRFTVLKNSWVDSEGGLKASKTSPAMSITSTFCSSAISQISSSTCTCSSWRRNYSVSFQGASRQYEEFSYNLASVYTNPIFSI